MQSPRSSASSASIVRARIRPDLVFVETKHKNESAVVVKDPVSLKYHRLRPDEFFVLQLLDGNASLQDIREQYENRFAPSRVSLSQLNQLLFRFHQSGLTISDALMQGDRLVDRRQSEKRQRIMQHVSGILFIRFPGVDPEPLLRRIYPLVRPLLGFLGGLAAAVLCLAALLLFVTQWSEFRAQLPEMHQWLRLQSVLLLMLVIGCTKILHELGHAILCKHFGGECHQIGPMLLVFAPALYCDTSDSWMLPNRFQRAAVGLAGIGTEVVLAAIATFVWVWTAPGLTHTIAMNVMLVCSVSTLLFNGNPLLRYDGYYVLSDLCDVANLMQRSSTALSSRLGRMFFGITEATAEEDDGNIWLLAYAFLATFYRWALTLLILWIVSIMLRPYGLESIGQMLCLLAAVGLLWTALRSPLRFLRNPARRRYIRLNRTLVSCGVLALLIFTMTWPIPSGVSAPGRIVPRSETPVYIATSGRLASLLAQPGTLVRKGDEIARLINHDVHLRYLQAKGRYDAQQQLVESIKRSRFELAEAANELPAAKALLEELGKQLETRKQRFAGLSLTSPATGRLTSLARRPEPAAASTADEYRLVGWSGFPTEKKNEGCFLDSGTELMSVVNDDNWDAELILNQSQVQRIEVGNRVKLVLEANPSTPIDGIVKQISRTQWTAEQSGQRQDDPGAVRRDQPAETSYVVRVQLAAKELTMISGATVTSRIEAGEMSVFARIKRVLSSLLRFR